MSDAGDAAAMYAHEYHKQLEQIAALQARLAQCEGERDNLKQSFEALAEGTSNLMDEKLTIKKERDAALERFGKLTNEARSYVTNRMYYSREEATKDLDKREKILIAVIEESEKALLALRAGMA